MLKIGFNARFLTHPFTGIGQYTRHLIASMAEVAPQNEYFLFTPELVDVHLPENCHQIRLAEKNFRSTSLKKFHWEQILLPSEMEKFNLDLVHFLYPSNPRKKLKWPTITTVHDVIPWVLPEYRKKIRSKAYHAHAKGALKKADHLITVSEFSKKEVLDLLKVDSDKVSVTHLAASPVADLGSFDLPLRRPYFLYVGGYDDRKNCPNLILAYQKHIAPYYPVDLLMVGGKGKGLEPLMDKKFSEKVAGRYPLKVKGRVILTEGVEPAELQRLYQQGIALVHPSFYEGFNLPLIEAMSFGLPIITSNLEVHHEVTGGNALFFNPENIDSIGLKMHELIHDRALQDRLKKEGLNWSKKFNWKKTAEETLYVYDLYT